MVSFAEHALRLRVRASRCLCSVQLRAWMYCTARARARARRKVGHRAHRRRPGGMEATGGTACMRLAVYWRRAQCVALAEGNECCHMRARCGCCSCCCCLSRGMEASRLDVSSTGPSAVPLFPVIAISTCSESVAIQYAIGMEMIRRVESDRSCLRLLLRLACTLAPHGELG